jgi:hypothetical protein
LRFGNGIDFLTPGFLPRSLTHSGEHSPIARKQGELISRFVALGDQADRDVQHQVLRHEEDG